MQTDKSTLVRTPIETKTVSDALGKVEIPLQPQRVIVLEENVVLDSVLALGIKPAGVMYCRGCSEQTGNKVNWNVGGPIGANKIIDDLLKYLVKTP